MLKKSVFIIAAALAIFLSSCSTEETPQVENFVTETIENFEVETRSGSTGCFEIVFPITINFPDGTTVDIDSLQQGKELISAWKEENPDTEEKPSLAYPIELINDEGEVLSAASRQELKEIVRECRMNNGSGGKKCFDIIYPVSVSFPDGTVEEFESRSDIKASVRAWKEENPDAEEKPSVVYPIEVELSEDGTIVTVNSKDELKELKQTCKE